MSFARAMEGRGWTRAREHAAGCPACGGVYRSGQDPRADRDKCWLSPEEIVTREGKPPITRPAGWKVICCGQYTQGHGPAFDSAYVLDPDFQPEGEFARQYILREVLEKIQAGQQRGTATRVAARGRGVGQARHVNKLERGTTVARPAEGEQAEKAENAQRLWDEAADSELIDAYLAARGRDPKAVRPMVRLRYHPRCPFGAGAESQRLPAILMPVTNAAGEIVAVHRIAIEPDGSGKSRAIGSPKKLLGSPLPGSWIDLPGDGRGGNEVFACEGPETGWAIAEATGWRVLVCVSTSGLLNLELPADQVGDGDGQIASVVFAADVDCEAWRVRTDQGVVDAEPGSEGWRSAEARQVGMSGQLYARAAAAKLRAEYPGLRVGVAFPRGKGLVRWDEHARVRPDRSRGEWVPVDAAAKSVDFEDMANRVGLAAVEGWLSQAQREAVAIRPRLAQAGDAGRGDLPPLDIRAASSGGDGDRVMPAQQRDVVEWFVRECYPSFEPTRATGASYRLVWMRERWWVYDGRSWREASDEEIRGALRRWLPTLGHWKAVGKGEDAEQVWFPVVPTERMLGELLGCMRTELHVPALLLPGYMQPTYAVDGRSIGFADDHARRMLTEDEADAEGLPRLTDCVTFADGVMPIESLLAGEPEVRPHDERLLSMSGVPYRWPEEATLEIRKGSIQGWLEDRCPHFIAHLRHIDDFNPGASEAIIRHHGASFVAANGDQTALWLHGPAGSGKSTLIDALMMHLGSSALLGMSLSKIARQEYQSQIEGKRAVVFGDAEGGSIDQLEVGEVLKLCIRGEALQARELFQRKPVEFHPFARLWFGSNRLFKIRDPGDAFAKSLVFVQFPQGVRGTARQSPAYAQRIKAEAAWSMVYAVWHGLRQYMLAVHEDRRPISMPSLHAESAAIFGQMSNMMGRFVEDHIEYALEPEEHLGSNGVESHVPWLSVDVLHEGYCRFLGVRPEDSKIQPAMVSADFKAEMDRARHERHKRMGGRRGAAYVGVRWRQPDESRGDPGSVKELWGDDTPKGAMWPEADASPVSGWASPPLPL